MLVEEAQYQRAQVPLLRLQMERMRRPFHDDQLMLDAGLLERSGEDLRLLHVHGLVGGAVQDQDRGVVPVDIGLLLRDVPVLGGNEVAVSFSRPCKKENDSHGRSAPTFGMRCPTSYQHLLATDTDRCRGPVA